MAFPQHEATVITKATPVAVTFKDLDMGSIWCASKRINPRGSNGLPKAPRLRGAGEPTPDDQAQAKHRGGSEGSCHQSVGGPNKKHPNLAGWIWLVYVW